MAHTVDISVSVSESREFKRLVRLAGDVLEHAERGQDAVLWGLVTECYADLLLMGSELDPN
jgi:hypothetical protein